MGGFPGRVWSVVRKWVKTACGRQRFNVLGALNFVTKKVETIVNTTYITSTEVIEMLEKLAWNYGGKPIKVILDNARYQRCAVVMATAKRLGIELVFVPTYSPNLNLIERVWKLVKSRALSCSYHETFNIFCRTILNCTDSLHSVFAFEMLTLISHKFCMANASDILG